MKEATGELNMTVIAVIAIAAIGALFYAFIWPAIQKQIVQQTCNTFGPGFTAEKNPNQGDGTASDKTSNWICKCDPSKGCTKDIIPD